MMDFPVEYFSVEPYIGNGKPQWQIYRRYHFPKSMIQALYLPPANYLPEQLATVDTETEARALIEHIRKPPIEL